MGKKSSGADVIHGAKVREVLQLLQKEAHLSKQQVEYCNEACIQRYLRARSGNPKKAAKQLRASLSWRDSLEIGFLTADDFPAELATGIAFVAGHDDAGRPVLVLRIRQEFLPPRSQKRFLRFLVFSFEVALASMPPGVEQWVMLIDFSGSTRASSSLLSFILSILKLVAEHYPERLAPSFFIDAPSVFYYLWKGMAPFIDHSTREKWSFAFLKDYPQHPEETAECSQTPFNEFSGCSTPSFRHTSSSIAYEERLSAMSFLTPLSSPGGQSFFKRNLDHSLGAALASDIQQRSLSFSSPGNSSFRTPEAAASTSSGEEIRSLGFYGSPVFLNSRSRRSSRELGANGVSYLLKREDHHHHQHQHQNHRSTGSKESFRPYIKFIKVSYNENSYRASMKPPLGGLLSVLKTALNLGHQTDS